jgi:hypothetical protein
MRRPPISHARTRSRRNHRCSRVSAARRSMAGSLSGPARGGACGGWATSLTRHGYCQATRGTRTSLASISTRMSLCPLRTARASSSSAAICSGRRSHRTGGRQMGDDRILLTLKTPWADGTRHLLFAPMELLEKLAALTPRPRINLIAYHGVLAPHARWRARVVASGSLHCTVATAPNVQDDSADDTTSPAQARHWPWANLMRRAFDADELACPRCGGRSACSPPSRSGRHSRNPRKPRGVQRGAGPPACGRHDGARGLSTLV